MILVERQKELPSRKVSLWRGGKKVKTDFAAVGVCLILGFSSGCRRDKPQAEVGRPPRTEVFREGESLGDVLAKVRLFYPGARFGGRLETMSRAFLIVYTGADRPMFLVGIDKQCKKATGFALLEAPAHGLAQLPGGVPRILGRNEAPRRGERLVRKGMTFREWMGGEKELLPLGAGVVLIREWEGDVMPPEDGTFDRGCTYWHGGANRWILIAWTPFSDVDKDRVISASYVLSGADSWEIRGAPTATLDNGAFSLKAEQEVTVEATTASDSRPGVR